MPKFKSMIIDREKVNPQKMLVREAVPDSKGKVYVSIPLDDWAIDIVEKEYKSRFQPDSLTARQREDWEKTVRENEETDKKLLKAKQDELGRKRQGRVPQQELLAIETEIREIQERLRRVEEYRKEQKYLQYALGETDSVPKDSQDAEKETDTDAEYIKRALAPEVQTAFESKPEVKRGPGRPKKETVEV